MKQNLFRKNLRKYRQQLNISQKDFANILGINDTTYRNYENTDREPDYDTLILIAAQLQISLEELLGVDLKLSENKNANKMNSAMSGNLKKLCNIYNSLSPIYQAALLERAETFSDLQQDKITTQNEPSLTSKHET